MRVYHVRYALVNVAIAGRAPDHTVAGRDDTLTLALVVVLSVIGFEQFLHTSPAAQSGSPAYEVLYWLSDSLLALPFAAVAVSAGSWIADRWGFGSGSVSTVFARAGVIALAFSIALVPGWFLHDDVDRLAHTVAVASGHAHGHDDEVHWAGDAVFWALILVPLASSAVWGGDRIGRWLLRGRSVRSSLLVRAAVIAALLALALPSAWYLERTADQADSGQVTYTSAGRSDHIRLRPHIHRGFTRAGPAEIAAADTTEGSVPAKVAHALRDGLAGQAVGLPVLFLVLLWRGGGSDRRERR